MARGNKFFQDIPGLTQDQAEKRAQRRQTQAEEKGKSVTVEAPGDVSVRATMSLSLSGTGTAWDMSYDIESVQHHFTVHEGYIMTITAKQPGQGDDSSFGQQAPDPGQGAQGTPDQGFSSYSGITDSGGV